MNNDSMAQQIAHIEEELKITPVYASSGNGLVAIEGNGTGHVTHVFLDPSLFTEESRQAAEDLLKEAYNNFQLAVTEASRSVSLKMLKQTQ